MKKCTTHTYTWPNPGDMVLVDQGYGHVERCRFYIQLTFDGAGEPMVTNRDGAVYSLLGRNWKHSKNQEK